MRRFPPAMNGALLACLGLAGCVPAGAGPGQGPGDGGIPPTIPTGPDPGNQVPAGRSPELPAPRPFTAADQRRAFEAVLAEDSSAALILFLARDPDGPFAAEARARLAGRRTPDPPARILKVAGSDAGVVEAFDAARLSGDPARLRAFAETHRGHPLAAEALRLSD